jgi:hypothetical protein
MLVQQTPTGITAQGGMVGQTIRILNLANLVHLFRDEMAFDQFLAMVLQKVVGDAVTILTSGDTAIATMYPADHAREAFQLRIAAKLAEDPHLLEALKDRTEDGKFIEYGTFDVQDGV